MGLFDKIKHGLAGSGVHTHIDGPSFVNADQPSVGLVITFTSKEAPVVLDGYSVTISREVEENQGFGNQGFDNQGFGMNGMGNQNDFNQMGNQGSVMRDAGQSLVGDGTPIDLQPGVPVSVNVEVPLNSLGLSQSMGQPGGLLGTVARMAENAAAADEQMEYFIHVKAQVQGTSHHAHASHSIRVQSRGGFSVQF